MSAGLVSAVVFACVYGGALLGMVLRGLLPERHRTPESKDLVRLGVGLIATMSALVLGLLVSSAKSAYDTQRSELTRNGRQGRASSTVCWNTTARRRRTCACCSAAPS